MPPSKSSSSEEISSSMSVLSGLSSGFAFLESATAMFIRVGHLNVGKVHRGAAGGVGSDRLTVVVHQ